MISFATSDLVPRATLDTTFDFNNERDSASVSSIDKVYSIHRRSSERKSSGQRKEGKREYFLAERIASKSNEARAPISCSRCASFLYFAPRSPLFLFNVVEPERARLRIDGLMETGGRG